MKDFSHLYSKLLYSEISNEIHQQTLIPDVSFNNEVKCPALDLKLRKNKSFILDNPISKNGKNQCLPLRKSQFMNEMSLSFQDLQNLHRMWGFYVAKSMKSLKSEENFIQAVLKTDFHGAKIQILESRNSELILASGIVFKESSSSIHFINSENKKIVAPKSNTLFLLSLPSFEGCSRSIPSQYRIYGEYITGKSSLRSTRKIKTKINKV